MTETIMRQNGPTGGNKSLFVSGTMNLTNGSQQSSINCLINNKQTSMTGSFGKLIDYRTLKENGKALKTNESTGYRLD